VTLTRQIHHRHVDSLPSATQLHVECARIVSCTAYVSLVCEHLTREDMYVAMEIPDKDKMDYEGVLIDVSRHTRSLVQQ